MNARLMLATTGAGIERAIRTGGEWRVQPIATAADIRCLAAVDAQSGVLLAGTQGDGVARSRDGGATWEQAGLPGAIVKALAVSPHDSDVIYAGLKPAGMAVSRDAGTTWRELAGFRRIRGRRFWFSPAERPGTAYVQAISVSPTDPDVLVAGIEFGAVVRSTDGGNTWSGHRPGALRDCHTLRFHPVDSAHVYQGGVGLRRRAGARSRDGGATWQAPRTGLERGYGWACAADPADPDTWYVSAAPGPGKAHGAHSAEAHIYRWRADGPWQRLHGGLPDPLESMPYALLTDPGAPGHVYAGLHNGEVWFSDSHGDGWRRLEVRLGAIQRELLVAFR